MQKIKCPNCGQDYEVPDDFTEDVTCQICNAAFSIQKTDTAPVPATAEKKCPFCGEMIRIEAIKCKHCGEFLDGRKRQASPQAPKAAKIAKSTNRGKGCLIEVVGLIIIVVGPLFTFPFLGIIGGLICLILGLVVIIIGSISCTDYVCSSCGTKLSSKHVQLCPNCKSPLVK